MIRFLAAVGAFSLAVSFGTAVWAVGATIRHHLTHNGEALKWDMAELAEDVGTRVRGWWYRVDLGAWAIFLVAVVILCGALWVALLVVDGGPKP